MGIQKKKSFYVKYQIYFHFDKLRYYFDGKYLFQMLSCMFSMFSKTLKTLEH